MIILDEGLPYKASRLLRDVGLDAWHVLELDMRAAPDTVILERAARKKDVIVTLDSDFHEHLAISGANRPSVIRIRIERLDEHAVARIVREVAARYSEALESGALVSVTPWQTRVRRLPLDTRSEDA